MDTFNRLWKVLAVATLAGTLSSVVAQTTNNNTNSILKDAVHACDLNKKCMAAKGDFLKNDKLIQMPELNLNAYDKQKVQEAFSLGWKARHNITTYKSSKNPNDIWWSKNENKGWDQETIDYVNDDSPNREWLKARELLNISSYPCVKQCIETRATAAMVMQYVFKKWLGR